MSSVGAGDEGGEALPAGSSLAAREQSAVAWLLLLGAPLAAFITALALSLRSDLMLPRCLVTLAPCLLIALSAGIARLLPTPQTKGSRLPALAAAAVLLVTYIAADYALSLEIKSNARDLARQVEAQVRPDDLIVITPAWMSSSFNYYFSPQNEQIGFPEQTRQEATYFNDLLPRLMNPEAWATTVRRIEEARQAGRRVWLVMLRSDITDQIPPGESLPSAYLNPASVAVFRSNHIRHRLMKLYGPPVDGVIPEDRRAAVEVLHAFLFDAGK